MCRTALILVSVILLTSLNCHAEKLGAGSSPLEMTSGSGVGMQIDVENVQKNVPFNVFVDWIGNKSYASGINFQGSLALALISIDNEIKELVHEEKDLSLSPGLGFGQWQRFCGLKVNTDVSDTDILCFITKENGDEDWLKVTSFQNINTCCNVRNNEVLKATVNVNVLGKNDITYQGHCQGTYGESRQYDAVYSSSYNIDINWPAGKDHHFVRVRPDLDRVQIDPNRILLQSVDEPEYNITLMACSDDELITECRYFNVKSPGTFGQQLEDKEDRLYINNISISGRIDESDIAFMRDEMPMLEYIDLSGADIVGNILPAGAFDTKGIKSIILPESLISLGANALRKTKLSRLEIPKGVRYYGLNALNYSEDLALIVLQNPDVIPVSWCVLEGVNRENGALFVPKGTREAFAADSQWGKFAFIVDEGNPDDWVSSNDGTYTYSGIYPDVIITGVINPTDRMEIPEVFENKGRIYNVTGIGGRSFTSYMIREIHIPRNITSIGEYAIESYSCYNLSNIDVDSENPAFFSDGGVLYDRIQGTMLTYPPAKIDSEYIVPEGIISIGGWACYGSSLNKITFPSTLKSIGSCAFCYSGLRYGAEPVIVSKAVNPPSIGSSAFNGATYSNAKVYVPDNSIESYRSHPQWGTFQNILPLTEESGVDDMSTDKEMITVTGNTVSINSNTVAEVYTIDGKLFDKTNGNSFYLPHGMYIIRVNGKVKKIRI